MSSAVIVVTGAGPSPWMRGMREPSTVIWPSPSLASWPVAGTDCSPDAACASAATGSATMLVPASATATNFMYRIYRPPDAFVTY